MLIGRVPERNGERVLEHLGPLLLFAHVPHDALAHNALGCFSAALVVDGKDKGFGDVLIAVVVSWLLLLLKPGYNNNVVAVFKAL